MSDPISVWREEHRRFAQLFGVLESQVARLRAGQEPDYDLMRNLVYYLRHWASRVHHPREDAAFARIVERDPGLRLPVNRLMQEHRVIATAEQELLRRLEDVEAGAMVERAALEAAADTYLAYYRHHLAAEEAEILPRAIELLTPRDWEAVAAAVPAGPDPLFGENFEAHYAPLRQHLGL
ncbi:MAG TPA: hemerythrin domain-containing protein [Burkholderiales bacterium]|nr:hemerythrin domain-containing protein [Burkholderiales bacterium]